MSERPSITPLLWYQKPRAALAWLEAAFGFETRLLVEGDGDTVIHSETAFGNGLVMVVGPPRDKAFSPIAFGGRHSQSVHIQMSESIDAHCERARAAGAEIQREPETQPYGDRVYTCRDIEGHAWSFGQTMVAMTSEEGAKATGHAVKERLS